MVSQRFSDFLKEEFYGTFKHKSGVLSEVFKNPTSDEFDSVIKSVVARHGRGSYFDIKGMIIGLDLYVWTGEFLHDDIAKKLNFYGTDCIPLYPEPQLHKVFVSTTMMNGHGFTTWVWSHHSHQIRDIVQAHRALKRVMGGFTVEEQ